MLPRLVDIRFQGLFTPLAGVLFAFPSRYWFTIGHQVVLSLGKWSSRIPTGLHVSRRTQVPPRVRFDFVYGAITHSGRPSQAVRLSPRCPSPVLLSRLDGPTTRCVQRQQAYTRNVWAGPRSLATTSGVSVDVLSYGYLDVSVPRVRFLSLCIQDKIPFNDTWKPQQQVALLL